MARVRHNQKQFEAQLTALQQECSLKGAGEVVRGKIIRIFEKIVNETPQWSGAAAATWRIGPATGSRPSGYAVSKTPLHSKGDGPAVNEAFSASSWINGADTELLRGVQITNPQDIISMLESGSAGPHPLRSVNAPGRMVARALASESGKYEYAWARQLYAKLRL